MRICSIALGGCLKAPPICFGLTEDTGGHLTYLWGAAAALSGRSDVEDVEVVTRLIRDNNLGSEYAQSNERAGPKLRITRIETSNPCYLSKEAAAADRPAFIAALIRELESRKTLPGIVHAHFADAAEVAIAIRERFGIPFIFTGHSLGIDKQRCGRGHIDLSARILMEDRAIAGADAIIASSRDEAERQLMLYPSADAAKVHRVPPGAVLDDGSAVDVHRARMMLAPFLREPDRPMVLAIARPVHKKNLPALIDMYAADEELRLRANLVIVAGLRDGPDSGEDEQRQVTSALLNRLDAHDLYGSLALPKRHMPDDISALYALARQTRGVFANPALTEPYGLTLTEAAHHGLPVVATSHGGASDIVRDLKHGLCADPNDPIAFTKAIRTLLFDADRWAAASRAGRDNSARLSWDAYADRFVEIARGVVARRTPVPTGDELLLCDIDNTLTGCRVGSGELAAQLQASPRRIFGIATGRSLQEGQRILREWNYPAPAVWVTSVGSEIYWRRGDVLTADSDYTEWLRPGWRPDEIAEILCQFPMAVPQAPVEQRALKRSWFVPDARTAMRVRARLDREGLETRVIFSHGRFLDILPARAGKGEAMRWVADRLGVPLSSVFAAGDSGNDLDMLELCPNAILVANHSAELAPLIGRSGVHVASRPNAGGIAEVMARIADVRPIEVAA